MILAMEPTSTPLDRREAVLEAFFAIVATRGLESASFRAVADEAGVSLGTVQHYFRSRDELLAATYAEVLRRIRARVAAIAGQGDARERVRRVLLELLPLDAVRRDECVIHLAFASVAPTKPALQQIEVEGLDELRSGLAQLVMQLDGRDADDATRLAHALAATADGLALHAVSTGTAIPETLVTVLDGVLEHLLPPGA